MNIWKAIGEKFGLDAAEAEIKYKNVRTAYGRYEKKSLFHLVLDVMLCPLQQIIAPDVFGTVIFAVFS